MRRSVRTVVSLVVALACCMVVALLPYETVFFLKIFGGGFALLAVAFAGILAVALPLALRESPVPNSDAAPWSLWVTHRNVALASPGWSAGFDVQRGGIIGLVGNSGNSDEPHLHVQAQSQAIFDVNSPPPGLITYPLLFDDAQVRRGDRVLPPQSADVRRGDRFSTIG